MTFRSLDHACAAAQLMDEPIGLDSIRPCKWAETYRCSPEEVKEAWEAAARRIDHARTIAPIIAQFAKEMMS